MSIRLALYRRSTGPPTSSPTQHSKTTEFYNLIILLTLRSILLPKAPLMIKLPELFLLILIHEYFLQSCFLNFPVTFLPELLLLVLLPELFLLILPPELSSLILLPELYLLILLPELFL